MRKRIFKQGLAAVLVLFMTINYAGNYLGRSPVVSLADTATVTATSLNVRSGPGTANQSVGKLAYGSSVNVLSQTTGSDGKVWYQIQFTNRGAQATGYVRSDYIKFPTAYQSDGNFEQYLSNQGFPESYKPGLRQLHAEYPNWVFTAQHTNLDWNDVINNESVVGRNLVPGSSPTSWKSMEAGAYNWETNTWPSFDSGSWVAASREIISYYMDPRNFLNEKYVFQFLRHKYNSNIHTIDGIKSMVQGTFLDNSASVSGTGTGTTSGTNGPGTTSGTNGPGTTSPGINGPGTTSSGTNGPGTTSGTDGPGTPSAGQPSSGNAGGANSGGTVSAGPGTSSGGSQDRVQPGVSPSSGGGVSGSSAAPGSSGTSGSGNKTQGSAGPGTSSGGSQDRVQPGVSPSSNGGGAPASGGNSNVSLQAPSASLNRRDTIRVGTAIGPGMSAGPGGSSSQSGGTYSAPTASYAEIIMNAAARSGVNPYVLTAMILQEQGTQGSRGVSGTVAGYEGYYNFFNIEAYKSGTMEAVERGLWFASQSGSYERPWNSVDKAIQGGAMYYGATYVDAGQDTFYLKKFNVQGSNLYKHQYMTNVQAAASEGAKLEQAYSSQLKQLALEFKIPVYKNMPNDLCAQPTSDSSPNNKLSSLSVDGYSLTPTFSRDVTSYNVIVSPTVGSVTVRAAASDSNAVVTGTGTIQLQSGNTDITIQVKAQNGTVSYYVIHVVRQNSTSNGGTASDGTGPGGPGAGSASPGGQAPDSGVSIQIITGGPEQSTDGSGTSGSGPGGSNVTIIR